MERSKSAQGGGKYKLVTYGEARDEIGKTGLLPIMKVFEWQAEKIVLYSARGEEILKVKTESNRTLEMSHQKSKS